MAILAITRSKKRPGRAKKLPLSSFYIPYMGTLLAYFKGLAYLFGA
jgi:hypothetical protein